MHWQLRLNQLLKENIKCIMFLFFRHQFRVFKGFVSPGDLWETTQVTVNKNVKQQAHIKVQTCLAHGYHLGLVPAWLPIWAPSIEASAAKSIIVPGRRSLAESLAHSTLVRCGREKGQDDRIFTIKKESRIQNHWTFLYFMGFVGVM